MLRPAQLDALLQDRRVRLEALYGERLVRLVLYGSYARGEVTEESDVDVLAVLAGEVQPSSEIFRTSGIALEVGMAHEAVISLFAVSEEAFAAQDYAFLRNVQAEGISV